MRVWTNPGQRTEHAPGEPASCRSLKQGLGERDDGELRRVVRAEEGRGERPAMEAVLTTWPTPCWVGVGSRTVDAIDDAPLVGPEDPAPVLLAEVPHRAAQAPPALLWTRCTAPKRSSAWSCKARTEAPSDTSVTTPMASAPRGGELTLRLS